MSLDKAIKQGREKRRPYYRQAQQVDLTCRNGGTCPYCYSNRMYRFRKAEERALSELRDYRNT